MLLDSLVGGMVGSLIGFLGATGVANRTTFKTAGARLRAAFAPELAIVRATPSNASVPLKDILGPAEKDLDRVLEAAFSRHGTAVEEFRFFVPPRSLAAYDAAWRGYYLAGGSIDFTGYMIGERSHEEFCERVEAIFQFTRVVWWQGWLGQ